jgi:S-adenosylmethionine hydrolase
MPRLITLTTDFGTRDAFVGIMKGVILRLNPDAILVDITHDIAPQNIEQAAYVLASAVPYFPSRTIHLVVVDPGVGSTRRAIAAQVGDTFFVAPDNGVLSSVLRPSSSVTVVHLTNRAYFLPRVSTTFHGRDIFAPVAAHLSLGIPLAALGTPIDDWVQLPQTRATRQGDIITGRVVYIDRFGNALTNIGEELLHGLERARLVVRVGAQTLRGIHTTYADVSPGEVLALVSSTFHVEIAVREGNAAQTLGIRVGDEVRIESAIC